MSPRIQREYKNLAELDVSKFGNKKVKVKTFSEEEKREIVDLGGRRIIISEEQTP